MKRYMALLGFGFILGAFGIVSQISAAELSLPAPDITAPTVDHKKQEKKYTKGESIDVEADVTDDSSVKSVVVFYRAKGAGEYKRLNMKRVAGTDRYKVSLPGTQASAVEYYIQATDIAGNSVLVGQSFDPLMVSIGAGEGGLITEPDLTVEPAPGDQSDIVTAPAPEQPSQPAPKKKGINKWVWVGLGAVALGGIAAASSGSDGPVVRDASVTISAPVPGSP